MQTNRTYSVPSYTRLYKDAALNISYSLLSLTKRDAFSFTRLPPRRGGRQREQYAVVSRIKFEWCAITIIMQHIFSSRGSFTGVFSSLFFTPCIIDCRWGPWSPFPAQRRRKSLGRFAPPRFLNITINKCDLHSMLYNQWALRWTKRAVERYYCLPRSHFLPGGSIGVPISLPLSFMPMTRSILPRIKLFGMPRPAS